MLTPVTVYGPNHLYDYTTTDRHTAWVFRHTYRYMRRMGVPATEARWMVWRLISTTKMDVHGIYNGRTITAQSTVNYDTNKEG